jgi:TonB family protein
MRTAILALLVCGVVLAQDSQTSSDAAIASLRKQIETNPENFAAHANLGRLYCELQRYTEAFPELEKAAAIKPESPGNQINLGGAYLGIGQTDRGLAILDKAVQDHPSAGDLHEVAYYLASHKLQLERAQQYAESAVGTVATELRVTDLEHLTPRVFTRVGALASFWDTLGWVHFQRGNLDEAGRFLNAAWALDQHGIAGDRLGQLYEQRGQRQEAIQAFAEALAAGGPLPDTRSRLAALVGGEDQIEPLVRRARDELVAMRTFKAGKLLAEKATAEFYIALVPAPGIPEVRFIRGDEKLRSSTKAIQAAAPPGVFPDSNATMLVRRGTLTCPGEGGECVFELLTTTAATKAENAVTAPSVLFKVEPKYSKEALKAKLNGTVVLYVEVTADGLPSNVRVVRGLGMGLDEKAIEAVKQWKFRPGYKDGRPVTVAARIEVNFRLLKDPKTP